MRPNPSRETILDSGTTVTDAGVPLPDALEDKISVLPTSRASNSNVANKKSFPDTSEEDLPLRPTSPGSGKNIVTEVETSQTGLKSTSNREIILPLNPIIVPKP